MNFMNLNHSPGNANYGTADLGDNISNWIRTKTNSQKKTEIFPNDVLIRNLPLWVVRVGQYVVGLNWWYFEWGCFFNILTGLIPLSEEHWTTRQRFCTCSTNNQISHSPTCGSKQIQTTFQNVPFSFKNDRFKSLLNFEFEIIRNDLFQMK